jgi:hypothetical protein
MQAPTHWNVGYRSTNALSPVLSPRNLLPLMFVALYFHFRKEIAGVLLNFFTFLISYFLKIFLSLKLRNMESRECL